MRLLVVFVSRPANSQIFPPGRKTTAPQPPGPGFPDEAPSQNVIFSFIFNYLYLIHPISDFHIPVTLLSNPHASLNSYGMDLQDLVTIELLKSLGSPWPGMLRNGGLLIETCQRTIWVGVQDSLNSEIIQTICDDPGLELRDGSDAYLRLLRISTGLESELPGETEIFGQIKLCWKRFQKANAGNLIRTMERIMQCLFEDTKEIRTHYLQGHGGASYGSLLRRLVSVAPGEKILIIGAGQLAKNILPYFSEQQLLLWNRTPEHIHEVLGVEMKRHASVAILHPDEEHLGWIEADHVFVCIPEDPDRDFERVQLWLKNQEAKNQRHIVHLGITSSASTGWESLPGLMTLKNLFQLEKDQSSVRNRGLEGAARACRDRALLRKMGSSTSLPHGWEDLVVFG